MALPMINFRLGASLIIFTLTLSVKITVKSSVSPDLYMFLTGTITVLITGGTASIKTLSVTGTLFNKTGTAFPNVSFNNPLFNEIMVFIFIPLLSSSPGCMAYKNTRVVVPEPF